MTDAYLPLRGIRVLDLSRLITGDLATRQLADLGADVVKVEDPTTGDYLRNIPPVVDGESVWHHLLNRNKRSVALDVKKGHDVRTILNLARAADVLVDVSRPGALTELGIDIEHLREERPDLVVCSITSFGQDGQWSMVPAHGINMDSLAGVVVTTEDGDGAPRFLQAAFTGMSQEAGASNAAIAVLAALVGVKLGHGGAWIDISCWDALVDMNRAAISHIAATGTDPRDADPEMWGPKHRIYRTANDQLVFVAFIEHRFWTRFCEAIERPDLIGRWASDRATDHGGGDELAAELESIMASRTLDEWVEIFVEHRLPGTPVNSLPDVIASGQFSDRAMLEPSQGRTIPNIAGPIRWLDRPGDRPGRHAAPPPAIGQDHGDVLAEWLDR